MISSANVNTYRCIYNYNLRVYKCHTCSVRSVTPFTTSGIDSYYGISYPILIKDGNNKERIYLTLTVGDNPRRRTTMIFD